MWKMKFAINRNSTSKIRPMRHREGALESMSSIELEIGLLRNRALLHLATQILKQDWGQLCL